MGIALDHSNGPMSEISFTIGVSDPRTPHKVQTQGRTAYRMLLTNLTKEAVAERMKQTMTLNIPQVLAGSFIHGIDMVNDDFTF